MHTLHFVQARNICWENFPMCIIVLSNGNSTDEVFGKSYLEFNTWLHSRCPNFYCVLINQIVKYFSLAYSFHHLTTSTLPSLSILFVCHVRDQHRTLVPFCLLHYLSRVSLFALSFLSGLRVMTVSRLSAPVRPYLSI